MKSFRKITAWAMALAISSTATAVTAFAEGTETTEPATTTVAEVVETTTVAPTEAPTQAVTEAPVVSPVLSSKFGTAEITVNTATNEVSLKDTATGMSAELKGSTINFDGSVIQTIDITDVSMTAEQEQLFGALAKIAMSVKIDTINFSNNVTEVKSLAVSTSMADNVKITFGKNIKTIASDVLGETAAKVTVNGYKGTAAETFASAIKATFVALDAETPVQTTAVVTTVAPSTETTVAATEVSTTAKATTKKTTAAKKTTTKKATTTTAKASDSPKTGDAGVGAIAGILALSAVTGAIAFRKKDNE